MAYPFPAMGDASRDPKLHGSTHTVYLWLACNLLNPGDWRGIKISGVAHAARISKPTASKAVRLLVARGYLKRRYAAGHGYEYLLLLNRESRDADAA
jgi:hypothetical protein